MARSVIHVASSTIIYKVCIHKVCRRSKSSTVHTMEKEAELEQEPSIKMVNINSVRFNSNHSAILANLNTSSKKVTITVHYKVVTGSDGT